MYVNIIYAYKYVHRIVSSVGRVYDILGKYRRFRVVSRSARVYRENHGYKQQLVDENLKKNFNFQKFLKFIRVYTYSKYSTNFILTFLPLNN